MVHGMWRSALTAHLHSRCGTVYLSELTDGRVPAIADRRVPAMRAQQRSDRCASMHMQTAGCTTAHVEPRHEHRCLKVHDWALLWQCMSLASPACDRRRGQRLQAWSLDPGPCPYTGHARSTVSDVPESRTRPYAPPWVYTTLPSCCPAPRCSTSGEGRPACSLLAPCPYPRRPWSPRPLSSPCP